MISIVSSQGKMQFPPGLSLERGSVVNLISHFMKLDPAYFILSYKNQEGDEIALDTDEDYKEVQQLRSTGICYIEISVDSISDVVAAEKRSHADISSTTPSEPIFEHEVEEREEQNYLKSMKQKKKQLEKEKAQEELKKVRKEKQKQAKLLKEKNKEKEKEEKQLEKEEQSKFKDEQKMKFEVKEIKKDAKQVKQPYKVIGQNSAQKRKIFIDEQKSVKLNSFIRTNTQNELLACTTCKKSFLIAPYYKCIECKLFNICNKCEANSNHEHPLLKIRKPEDVPLLVVSVTANQLQNYKNEQEFVNELKNIAIQKLNTVHRNKIKCIRDEQVHVKQFQKEKEKQQPKLYREKGRIEQQLNVKGEWKIKPIEQKKKKEERKEQEYAEISNTSTD